MFDELLLPLLIESSAISSLLNTIMATSGSAAMWTTLQIITTGKVGVLGKYALVCPYVYVNMYTCIHVYM